MLQTTFLLHEAHPYLKSHCNSPLILFTLLLIDWIAARLAIWIFVLCIIVIILTLFIHLVFLYVFDYLLALFFFSFITCVL